MQAVILAAGASVRFHPFNATPKAMFPVLGDPIVVHTIRAIKRAGITDIIIVADPKNFFEEALGNGKKYGVKIRYAILKEPTGMGDGLLAAEKLITSDFFVLFPHHINFDELKNEIDKKRGTNRNAVLIAREEENVRDFGVIRLDGDKVTDFIEKPQKGSEPSKLKVIGVYFLNNDYLKVLKAAKREHYSFEAAIATYAKSGNVRAAITKVKSASLKYPWDLLTIKDSLLLRATRHISKKATIAKSALIEGDVVIEDGATILENAVIKGPAYIGKDVLIGTNSLIRNESDIEEGAKIGSNIEVKNTLVAPGSTTHSGLIEDSVIGANCRIGAGVNTANTRLDRKNVEVEVKGVKVDSGMRHLGMFVGDNSDFGANVTTMPGVIIGSNTKIGPSTTVMKNVESNVTFYTKFKEFITKPAQSK